MEEIIQKVNESDQKKFLIIDGNSIMNRAFYGIRLLTTKDGLYTNAIYGFLNIYYMIINKLTPDYVGVTFDLRAPTFRHEMFTDYKAQRKGMPDELKVQMPIVKEVLKAMNIPIVEVEGFEADDVLGTVSRINSNNNVFTYILTGDKDSLQLISDKTNIVIPTSKMGKTEYTIYNEEKLNEKYGIEPRQVIDVKALMGDTSDNIPGVKGIGEKTAYSLIIKYGNLENIYDKIDCDSLETTPSVLTKLKDGKEMAFTSYKLATICLDVPVEVDYTKFELSEVNTAELTSLFTRLSFKKFLEKYEVGANSNNSIPGTTIETSKQKDFYKNYTNTAFTEITKTADISDLFENLGSNTSIIFRLLEEDNFKALVFKTGDTNYNYILIPNDGLERYNINNNDDDSENIHNLLYIFCSSRNKKISYDIKPFFKLCMKYGIKDFSNFYSDIKIAYHLLHANESNYSIENITYKLLEVNFPDKSEFENQGKTKENNTKPSQTSLFDVEGILVNVTEIEKNDMEDFVAKKAFMDNEYDKKYVFAILDSTEKIHKILLPKIEELNMNELYFDIEMRLIETLAAIESAGMYIDKEKLLNFGEEISRDIDSLEKQILNMAGEEFNINSPMQLGKILFEKLGLPYSKKNKSGYSTDKEVLESLTDKHEIINKILDYRVLTKLKSTYVDGLLSVIADDGRIHTTFMQTVTATGRLSSIEPNLQNIPVRTEIGSKIRECFVPQENNIIIDADYSQIELRILAHMANDPTMISAFCNNKDIHAITASQVFDTPLEEVTHELRGKAKAVNFGIVYGISAFGLAKNINSSRQEAQEYIDNYFEKYSKVKEYMDNNVMLGTNKGYVSTMFGRIRFTDELKASNKNVKMFGERIAMNMPIQGTAADIIKKAMNEIYLALKERNLKSRIIMQVHDELIIESPPEEVYEACEILRSKMENVCKLSVPLMVDINSGKSWADAK